MEVNKRSRCRQLFFGRALARRWPDLMQRTKLIARCNCAARHSPLTTHSHTQTHTHSRTPTDHIALLRAAPAAVIHTHTLNTVRRHMPTKSFADSVNRANNALPTAVCTITPCLFSSSAFTHTHTCSHDSILCAGVLRITLASVWASC